MDNLQSYPVTQTTTKAGLGAGTTTTYSTANTVQYSIKGKAYLKTAVANGAVPVTDAVDALPFTAQAFPANAASGGQGSVYVFGFDAAGNIKVAQGTVENLDVQGNFITAPQFPVVPDTIAPFGYMVVKLGPTAVANWTFSVNNLSGVTGVTYTFVDIQALPDRPQIA